MKKGGAHRLVGVILAVAMLLPLMPHLSLPASAATIAESYTYKITVKNGNVKYAGTDNDVSCLVEDIYGVTKPFKLDSKSNDFERNDCRTYSFNLDLQPWEIKKVGLKHSGGIDGVNIAWFEFILPNGTKIRQDVNRWFEKSEEKYYVWGQTDRQVNSRGNFDSQFSGAKYYAPDVTSGQADIVMDWNGLVSDQYFSNYQMSKYAGAIGVSFSSVGKSYGYSSLSDFGVLTDNGLAKVEARDNFDHKITLYTNKLLDYMKRNKIYKFTLTSTLDYGSTDEYDKYSTTYTIYRTGFELLAASAVTAAYTPEVEDNYFYNSDPVYSTFEIKIPVKSLDNYTASTIASSLAANIKNGASATKVYYDRVGTNGYVTPKNAYSRGADIYLVCNVPADYANEENVYLRVVIENAKATCNGNEYTLDRDGAKYDSESELSTHKVDTKGLTHTLTDKATGNVIDPAIGFDTYRQNQAFSLAVSGNSIYIDDGRGGRTEGNFSYRLYTKGGGTEIELAKHNGMKTTSNVPYASNAIYNITPLTKLEGEYTLEVSSRDFANNLSTTSVPVKLDMIAPRVSYALKQVSLIDGSKRNEYTFRFTEATGTGRLYYVFVEEGQAMPDTSVTKPESSGPEDTVYGKWGFIDQINGDANTVVLALSDGDYFRGALYWYTTDEAGNDSRTEKNSGATADGYYYTAVELNNVKSTCELILGDVTPGRPSYEIAFETASLNRVEYRWKGKNVVTAFTTYTKDSRPGAAVQRDGSGNSVTLNGEYTLEYVVITPDGNRTTYTRDFLFDNTEPKITFVYPDQRIGDSKGITVAAEDITNITRLAYQLFTAGGVAVGEVVELPVGLPVVSSDIVLMPEETGSYQIRVTATDVNGQTTESVSRTFDIRTGAPMVTIEHYVSTLIDGYYYTNSQDFELMVTVEEAVNDIDFFDTKQQVMYRLSTDGVNYSNWVVLNNYISTRNSKMTTSIYLDDPATLVSGENRIYVQTAFLPSGEESGSVRTEFIGQAVSVAIIYDAQAPQYKLQLEASGMTNNCVTGTLTFTDNYTAAEEIDITISNGYIELTPAGDGVVNITVSDNVDGAIYLKDLLGNTTEVPIHVNCIDKEAPELEFGYGYEVYSGERQDYYLSFLIDKAMDSKTLFALVEGTLIEGPGSTDPSDTSAPTATVVPSVDPSEVDDALFGPLPESVKLVEKEIVGNYENGETETRYEAVVYGDEEVLLDGDPADGAWWEEWRELNRKGYVLVVKTEDALGNSTKQAVGSGVILTNATAKVQEAYCAPRMAHTQTALVLNMSVPAYVLPDDRVPAAIKAMNLADGRLDTSDDAEVAAFVEMLTASAAYYSTECMVLVGELGEKPVYFTDECGRVYKQTIVLKDLSEEENGESADKCTAYVSFGNEPPVSVKIYRAPWGADQSQWVEINVSDVQAYNSDCGYAIYVVLEPISGDGKTVTLNEESISSTGGSWDFYLEYGLSEYDYSANGYTKLVYSLSDTLNVNKLIAYSANISGNDIEETVGSVFELTLKDTTSPEVEVYYSTNGYTNSAVNVTVFASDTELSVNGDEGDASTGSSAGEEVSRKELSEAELAELAGISDMSVYRLSADTDIYCIDYEDLDFISLGQVSQTTLAFEDNGYAVIKVTNTLGLVTYRLIEVGNINREEIVEGADYTVKYYYRDANGVETEVDGNGYYGEVTARVEFTWQGEYEKELTVVNNLGAAEKVLTSYDDSFTFRIVDRYGNAKDVPVSFARFDTVGPDIAYLLDVTEKTNQPFYALITVTDLHSAPGNVTAIAPSGNSVEVEDLGGGKFIMVISESGFYTLVAADVYGNESTSTFLIDNIDTTTPSIVQKMATTTQPTRQSVGIKLYYSEAHVVLQRVEIAEGTALTADDIVVDFSTSTIRFNENGTVSVWFVDEYGNVGTDTVTVSNINRTPPSLYAVQTVAEDELSVEISFEKMLGELRELSDLYVLYGGVTPMLVELDDEGNIISERVLNASEVKFTLIDNGTYTFHVYDSIGNIQEVIVEVTGIDRTAPVITRIDWAYSYVGEDGKVKYAAHSIVPGDEAGYSIVGDEIYRETNQDIEVTVTTDDKTKFVGSNSDYSRTNFIIFDEDGWFNFNLVKPNGLMDSYGLGLYLIDKEAPVIGGVQDLMFFENPNAGTPYSKELLTYSAYDVRYGVTTDLTSEVEIDWGGFNPDDFMANTFDKNSPYTITYTVRDHVGNETVVRRKITLVGIFDTMIRVNGMYPGSAGSLEVLGSAVELTLDNFAGTAYARYEKGVHTMGEMKHIGTVIQPENGKFRLENLAEGWYTFYVQTDLRDYFCVNIYVYNQ